jgi:hypothetical protein
MIITILAYKSDSDDYCRGCVMARYSSDFQWKSSMDRGEIEEFLAGLMFANKHLDHGEAGYEITFLFNGEECNDEWDSDAIRKELTLEATALYVIKENAFQIKKSLSEKMAAAKQKRDTEERERQQLAQLQAKYGTTVTVENGVQKTVEVTPVGTLTTTKLV